MVEAGGAERPGHRVGLRPRSPRRIPIHPDDPAQRPPHRAAGRVPGCALRCRAGRARTANLLTSASSPRARRRATATCGAAPKRTRVFASTRRRKTRRRDRTRTSRTASSGTRASFVSAPTRCSRRSGGTAKVTRADARRGLAGLSPSASTTGYGAGVATTRRIALVPGTSAGRRRIVPPPSPRVRAVDARGNAVSGDAIAIDCEDCVVLSEGKRWWPWWPARLGGGCGRRAAGGPARARTRRPAVWTPLKRGGGRQL